MHAQLPLWNIAFQLITWYLSCSGLLVSSLSVSYQIRTTWNMPPHTPQAALPRVLLAWHWSKLTDSVYMSTSLTSYMARLQTRIKIGREGTSALCLNWTWKDKSSLFAIKWQVREEVFLLLQEEGLVLNSWWGCEVLCPSSTKEVVTFTAVKAVTAQSQCS